jgi:hypothetical protein
MRKLYFKWSFSIFKYTMEQIRGSLRDAVIETIAQQMPISAADRQYITEQVARVDLQLIASNPQPVATLSNIIFKQLKKTNLDIKEYLKSAMGQAEHQINDREPPGSLADLLRQPKTAQSIFNPAALERTAYLKLDSQAAVFNTPWYTWPISTVSKRDTVVPQALVNITRIRMLPLVIPGTACGSTVAVAIAQITQQTYAADLKYAFVFGAAPLSSAARSPIKLTDLSLTTETRLINPLAELTQISIGFFDPHLPMSWTSPNTTASATSTAQGTRLTFATPPKIADGDQIIIDRQSYNVFDTTELTADISGVMLGIVAVRLCSREFTIHLEVTFMPGF